MADNSHDLDELLDSALDDFNNLNLTSSSNKGDKLSSSSSSSSSLPTGVKGLGLGLPELGSKKKGKQKAVKDNHVTEALEKLREQTRETVRGLESTTAKVKGGGGGDEFGMDGMMEEWVNQFQEIAGGQDMDSVMEIMMKQLLSRDILHEPMKEIGERYPKWLEEHKSGLSKEEYDRYSHQYELITELNNVYENDPGNYSRIVELMQKMQECGQPPNDIVRELAPDVDFSDISQLSPEMLQQAQSNCCIM